MIIASHCEITQNARERASDVVLAEPLDVIDEAMPIICKKGPPEGEHRFDVLVIIRKYCKILREKVKL